jgi:hypothetical protein
LLILFAIVGRGCDPGPARYSPPSHTSTGYSDSSYSSAVESPTLLYAQRELNVRSGPGTDYPVVRTLSRGDAVQVGEADDRGWARVGATHSNEYVYRPTRALSSTSPPLAEPKPTRKRPHEADAGVSSTGATAMCRDGSLSYSAHRRGTCSHHGGVAVWY